jgi:hypothetical protein
LSAASIPATSRIFGDVRRERVVMAAMRDAGHARASAKSVSDRARGIELSQRMLEASADELAARAAFIDVEQHRGPARTTAPLIGLIANRR